MIFTCCSLFGARDPGPGPKAAARARPGPGSPPLWDPGPGPGPQTSKTNMKIIWNECANNVIRHFHILFIFIPVISYDLYITFTFGGSGPRSGPQSSYYVHIPGHMIFIFCENLVSPYFHTDNLCNAWHMNVNCRPQDVGYRHWGVQLQSSRPLFWKDVLLGCQR